MACAEPQDPPDEEFDLTQPYWVGYFRLPKDDVDSETLFQPNYRLLPRPPKRVPPCNLRAGTWKSRKHNGEREEKKVLIKSIDTLHEREARILSSVSGSDALAKTYNIIRFYGATIDEAYKEYQLVLEHCDMYLQDYVLDKSLTPDPLQWHTVAKDLCKQIANGMRYLHWKAPYNPIIHRDLHPLSVLLIRRSKEQVTAKIYGFQHAKILGDHKTVGGNTVAPISVELWQAPEYVQFPARTRASVEEDYTKVDVYSYAMLVWHIFARALPYDGKKMVLSEIIASIIRPGKRPEIPEDTPDFWRELMTRSWQDDLKARPDFIKIYKAIGDEDATILDPHRRLSIEAEKRADWELDPRKIPTEGDRIISNKSNTYSVVLEAEGDKVVLKRPVKKNREPPSEEEFKRFMEFSAGLNHPNILRYDGVFFLESLQMALMTCSVRQYREGRTVMREVKLDKDGPTVKAVKTKGWGSMQPKAVKQVTMGVLKGLSYLHTVKNVSHDGLSSSNVLLNYQKPSNIEEVKLVDYQLGLLGTSPQSHASRNCMYEAPKGTDPKRADLYSLGVLMVYMYKGEPSKRREKKADWEKKTHDFKTDKVSAMVTMWKLVVNKCLNLDEFPSLTANEVLSELEAITVFDD